MGDSFDFSEESVLKGGLRGGAFLSFEFYYVQVVSPL